MQQLLRAGQIVTCGPVVAELLTGTTPQRQPALTAALTGIPWIHFGQAEWERAGAIGFTLERQGARVQLIDLCIAVAAEAAGAELWTFDSDYQRVAAVMPGLRLYQPPV